MTTNTTTAPAPTANGGIGTADPAEIAHALDIPEAVTNRLLALLGDRAHYIARNWDCTMATENAIYDLLDTHTPGNHSRFHGPDLTIQLPNGAFLRITAPNSRPT